jgi:hypothetical protein
MKQLLCGLILVVLIAACKKNNNNNNTTTGDIYGRYTGTFSRTGMDTVPVTLFFKNDNTFEGTGGAANYPAICSGHFQKSSNTLMVSDTCVWTANFDWSLIFAGNYSISFSGTNAVRVWRTNGAITDEYLLRKLIR